MTKVFCDICGSEIHKNEKEYKLECLKLDKNKEQYDYVYKSENVCHNCIVDINNFIANHLRTYTLISKKDIDKDTDTIKDKPIYNEKAVYSYTE